MAILSHDVHWPAGSCLTQCIMTVRLDLALVLIMWLRVFIACDVIAEFTWRLHAGDTTVFEPLISHPFSDIDHKQCHTPARLGSSVTFCEYLVSIFCVLQNDMLSGFPTSGVH